MGLPLLPGTYTGPPNAPTTLDYEGERIVLPNGGLFLADVVLHASLVPEPSTLALLTIGVIGLLWVRRQHALPALANIASPGAACRCERNLLADHESGPAMPVAAGFF